MCILFMRNAILIENKSNHHLGSDKWDILLIFYFSTLPLVKEAVEFTGQSEISVNLTTYADY